MAVSDGHIRTLLRDCSYEGVRFVRRIVSGRHGKPTTLVRVISSSHQDVQNLLKQWLYDADARRLYRAEPSHASSAPMQCTKCFRPGHLTSGCTSEVLVCSKCGAKGHTAPQCKQERPSCLLCQKEHSALSRQCSRRQRAAVERPAPFHPKLDPAFTDQPSALAAGPINAADAFYLLASTLLVAFPSQRSAMVSAVNEAARSLWGPGASLQLQGNLVLPLL